MMQGVYRGKRAVPGLLLLSLALATLLFAPLGRSDALDPAVSLGPISVANGTATLSGTVNGTAPGTTLTVNGQPLGIGANGAFAGSVNLAGQSQVSLSLTNPANGQSVTTTIPLNSNILGPGGVVPASVLDALRAAVITITKPADGFKILDGLPLEVGGSVLDRDRLAGLTVNGVDVLGKLRPDGTFAQQLPGSTERVAVTATDRQGVSQTTTFGVQHSSSVISTPAGPSISAAGANGIKIAKVRYITKGVKKTKRIRMIVTVRDKSNRLVRDAIVRAQNSRFKRTLGRAQIKLSGKVGTATFTFRVTKKAFGKRVFLLAHAKTPTAQAKKVTSAKIPRLKAKRR